MKIIKLLLILLLLFVVSCSISYISTPEPTQTQLPTLEPAAFCEMVDSEALVEG